MGAAAAAGPLGAIIGGAFGLGGAKLQAKWAAKEARRQRRWQERMRATAYQATMEDMSKAGLNPILAYKQGATGAGQGAMANIPDVAGAMTKGADAGTRAGLAASQGKLLANQAETQRNVAIKEGALATGAELDLMEKRVRNEQLSKPGGKTGLIYKEWGWPGLIGAGIDNWDDIKSSAKEELRNKAEELAIESKEAIKRGAKRSITGKPGWKKKTAERYKHRVPQYRVPWWGDSR